MAGRLPVSLFAVTLLLGSLSGASVAYLCAMTGELGPSCCCHAAELELGAGAQPAVERASCCDVQRTEASHPLATCERAQDRVEAVVLARAPAPIPEPHPPAHQRAKAARDSRGPPLAHWPPLFIRNCRFLI